jgi:hypothetical protein
MRHIIAAALSVLSVTPPGFYDSDIRAQSNVQTQPGLRIVVIEGEDAVNIIQQKTAVAPVVEVRDRNDLPVSGAVVTFTIASKNATFAGGSQTVTAITNAAGRASAAVVPSGTGTLQIGVQTAVSGETAVATITQTNFATVQAAASAGQTASGGTAPGGGAGGGGLPGLVWTGIVAGAAAGGYVAYDKLKEEAPAEGPPQARVLSFTPPAGSTVTLGTTYGLGWQLVSPPRSYVLYLATAYTRDDGAVSLAMECSTLPGGRDGGEGSTESGATLTESDMLYQFGRGRRVNAVILLGRQPICAGGAHAVNFQRGVAPVDVAAADIQRVDIPLNWLVQ